MPEAKIQLNNAVLPAGGNPIEIDANQVTDEISIAYKYDDGQTEIFVFGTEADGSPAKMHNGKKLSRTGARCGTAAGDVFATAPTSNLCNDGSTPPVSSGSGEWTWTCAGIDGGDPVDCAAIAPVDGQCGAANGQLLTEAPSGTALCYAGTASDVSGGSAGPWNWSCEGSDGGRDATNCSATLRPSGNPDLKLSSMSGISSSYNAGDNKQITITLTNVGNASTAVANACTNGQIAVRVYQGNSGNTKTTVYVNDLEAGAAQSLTLNFTADQTCGIHQYCTFVVEADSNKCVTESPTETNNTSGRVSLRTR